MSQPKMFTGGASRFDVAQGMLGDCWLVAAIASLTQDRILLEKVKSLSCTSCQETTTHTITML